MSIIPLRIFGGIGLPEIAIIAVVILLIFGARRLPEIGSSMGKGIRTFKSALMGEEEKTQQETSPAAKGNDKGSPY